MKDFYFFSIIYFIMVTMAPCSYGSFFFKYINSNSNNLLYSSNKINDQLSLRLLWNCKIGCGLCGGYVNLRPVYTDSYIFVADYYGIVKKINFHTGICSWEKNLSEIIIGKSNIFDNSSLFLSGISVDRNYLYIGSELSKVYALDIKTGALLWIVQVSGEVISVPVISNCGLVLVYTSNGVLQALDKRTGKLVWDINFFEASSISFRVTLVPVIFSNIVVIGSSNGIVSACCVDTGDLIWQKSISNVRGTTDIDRISNIARPIVINNRVYAVAYNGDMVALDIFSGNLIWSKNIGSLVGIVAEDNIIYVVDQNNRVIALNLINGNFIWSKSNLIYCQLLSIMLYKEYILIGDTHGSLYFLHKKDGTCLGKTKITKGIISQTMIVLNKLVIYEKNGILSIWDLII